MPAKQKSKPTLIVAPCPRGSLVPVVVTLRWRDENYGSIRGALAFRPQIEPFPTDRIAAQVRTICNRHGFRYDDHRAALIARDPAREAPEDLVADFREAGFTVTHAGYIPAPYVCHPSDGALTALRQENVDFANALRDDSLRGSLETLSLDQLRAAAAGYNDDDLIESREIRIRVACAALAIALNSTE